MDLTAIGAKAILVPTPGQTEQEYLAKRIREQRIAYTIEQEAFDLSLALQQVYNYTGFVSQPNTRHKLIQALREIIA
jgi:UDP-N-acetylglucosamine:LPS N-acetylglucosamine transferase